jgi:hypothetical protein
MAYYITLKKNQHTEENKNNPMNSIIISDDLEKAL